MSERWDSLYEDDRFDLKVPAEQVVRFLTALQAEGEALDIGCGTGRHLKLLRDLGWKATGVDSSPTAAAKADGFDVRVADMGNLPFKDSQFTIAIAHGVFCYGTLLAHERAAAELRRVLKKGGKALIRTRTTSDWRATGLSSLDVEAGMTMNFLDENGVGNLYKEFGSVQYEWIEWTEDDRARKNSDWLITVEK